VSSRVTASQVDIGGVVACFKNAVRMARTEEDVRVRMREILGRFETLTPRDFLILKAAKIHYKSGSHSNLRTPYLLKLFQRLKKFLRSGRGLGVLHLLELYIAVG
jgi:hypothetical protein